MSPLRSRTIYRQLLPSFFLLLLPTCGGGGGGGGSSPPPPPPNTVRVGSTDGYGTSYNVFAPVTLTVSAGTTVTWSWAVSGHSVDSGTNCTPDGLFSSGGTQSAGHTMTHTFAMPGTYPYYCTPHCSLGMTGTIIVQ